MCALDEWTVDDVARPGPPVGVLLHAHPRSVLESVLDMLAGPLPQRRVRRAARPHHLGPRCPTPSPAAAAPSGSPSPRGGTIPDRGLYAVFLATGEGPGRRVGELDEEMVYESRVGDLFTLGTSTWRIEDITHDRVLVTPAPGLPGRLPFWKGDSLGRPAELGRAVGAFVREVEALTPEPRASGCMAAGLDDVGRRQPARLPARAARGHRPRARRPRHRRRAVPRRARRLAGRHPLAVRRAGARPVGAGRERPDARPVRRRRAGDARRRRHRAAAARPRARRRRRRARARGRPRAARPGHPRPRRRARPGHRARSAARRCSRRGSASARPGRCCSPAAAPTGASRCGSSASGPRSCSRSPASTRPSRSCSRPCASASRTSSTCPGWSS